jgi:hypothetical protein
LVEVDLTSGRGSERLAWSIGLDSGTPNLLSELTFQRTASTEGSAKLRWRSEQVPIGVQLDGRFGVLEAGTVRDDDFAENNRQGLVSRSISQIDGNALFDLGYRTELVILQGHGWEARTDGLWGAVGWRFSQQTWRVVQGRQVVPREGPLDPRLNSTYRARWQGPELALLAQVRMGRAMELRGELVGWPVLWYEGEGKWNLRPEFRQDPSFRHEAKGYGLGSSLEGRWWFGAVREERRAFVGLGWQWQWMATKPGTDTTFFQDGSEIVIKFNRAERQSQYWFVTAGCVF